ncbi:MAG: DUF1491 family protein [Pseudomonadota bacterium]
MAPRLTAEFWVAAYLARLRLADIPAFVTAKGAAEAGAVLVKSNTLNGQAQLWQRSFGLDGERKWRVLAEGQDSTVEESIARQKAFDPDLWVVEVEDRDGRTLLGEEGLA